MNKPPISWSFCKGQGEMLKICGESENANGSGRKKTLNLEMCPYSHFFCLTVWLGFVGSKRIFQG